MYIHNTGVKKANDQYFFYKAEFNRTVSKGTRKVIFKDKFLLKKLLNTFHLKQAPTSLWWELRVKNPTSKVNQTIRVLQIRWRK